MQYALRSGKPYADILIYYPFLNIEEMPDNQEEFFTKGYLADVEGPLPQGNEHPNPAKEAWSKSVYPLINDLESSGITWAWVNDASLQEAQLQKDGRINIRGNQFAALILANDSIIQLKTAEQIRNLASKGMRLLATGLLPTKQPSFLNWKENDQKTAQSIAAALKAKNSRYIQDESELREWIKDLYQPIKFKERYSFTRQAQRNMSDDSRIDFIWNKSDKWQILSLILDKKFRSSYWMDADGGTITKNNNSTITYQIPPYSSVVLYASTKQDMADSLVTTYPTHVDPTKEILTIKQWNIKSDSIELKQSHLFDWKQHNQLKFSSAEGVYTSTFQWEQGNTEKHYFLDLGNVCYTAEVYINKKLAGKRVYAPYLLDITSFLMPGTNQIEVRVTPGQLNGFISNAKNGDRKYAQFKGKEDQLMSGGLIGPVKIRPGK